MRLLLPDHFARAAALRCFHCLISRRRVNSGVNPSFAKAVRLGQMRTTPVDLLMSTKSLPHFHGILLIVSGGIVAVCRQILMTWKDQYLGTLAEWRCSTTPRQVVNSFVPWDFIVLLFNNNIMVVSRPI